MAALTEEEQTRTNTLPQRSVKVFLTTPLEVV